MEEDTKKEIKEAAALMQEVANDRSVPRNIRAVVEEAAHGGKSMSPARSKGQNSAMQSISLMT